MKRVILMSFLLIYSVFFGIATVSAQEVKSGNYIQFARDRQVNENLFMAGREVVISGTVNGDLYTAGRDVVIDGIINGDVLAAGGIITIRGSVSNNIRVVGGEVIIAGTVGGNVSAAGGAITLVDGAKVAGSMVAAGGKLSLLAPVAKGASLVGSNVTLGNIIGGNVIVRATQLTPLASTEVKGNLTYYTDRQISLPPGATVSGQLQYHHVAPPQTETQNNPIQGLSAAWFLYKLMVLIISLLVGLLLLKLFPVFTTGTASVIGGRPWASFGLGLGIVFLVPIICILLFITIFGIPLSLLLLFAYVLYLFFGSIFTALFLGQLTLRFIGNNRSSMLALVIGEAFYIVLITLPLFGGLISLVGTCFGVGAMAINKFRIYKVLRKREEV
ncbi:hypothetical protein HGB07_05150 [Candidatus Roizmanbacteria bacterium]|nr:hypothetical protein [Candidatus Roizmanbacteria bacterium]